MDAGSVAAPLAFTKHQHLPSFDQRLVAEVCDLVEFGHSFSFLERVGQPYHAALCVVYLIAAADEVR